MFSGSFFIIPPYDDCMSVEIRMTSLKVLVAIVIVAGYFVNQGVSPVLLLKGIGIYFGVTFLFEVLKVVGQVQVRGQ